MVWPSQQRHNPAHSAFCDHYGGCAWAVAEGAMDHALDPAGNRVLVCADGDAPLDAIRDLLFRVPAWAQEITDERIGFDCFPIWELPLTNGSVITLASLTDTTMARLTTARWGLIVMLEDHAIPERYRDRLRPTICLPVATAVGRDSFQRFW